MGEGTRAADLANAASGEHLSCDAAHTANPNNSHSELADVLRWCDGQGRGGGSTRPDLVFLHDVHALKGHQPTASDERGAQN